MKKPEIVIIGGGFSGLLTAYLLRKEGVAAQVHEARGRLGGRVHTQRLDDGSRIEMGATWLGKKHHRLLALLDELDIGISEQHMGKKGYYEPMSVLSPQLVDLPPSEESSYRIAGGTDTLIRDLAGRIDQRQIRLNAVVKAVKKTGATLEIQTESGSVEADFAISTLPPKLLVDSIDFLPALPDELTDIASATHTWMADSIKVALAFEEPFWRNPNSSGTIFSNVGPVNEMYDHSSDGHYALKGFMSSAYQATSREQRKRSILKQLRRFYGRKVDSYLYYQELVWGNEPFTCSSYEQPVIPHQHNGHSVFQRPFLDGKLLIAGSETAAEFPGYMDGAVESAQRTARQLKHLLS